LPHERRSSAEAPRRAREKAFSATSLNGKQTKTRRT
jgi:hypothetical protein